MRRMEPSAGRGSCGRRVIPATSWISVAASKRGTGGNRGERLSGPSPGPVQEPVPDGDWPRHTWPGTAGVERGQGIKDSATLRVHRKFIRYERPLRRCRSEETSLVRRPSGDVQDPVRPWLGLYAGQPGSPAGNDPAWTRRIEAARAAARATSIGQNPGRRVRRPNRTESVAISPGGWSAGSGDGCPPSTRQDLM